MRKLKSIFLGLIISTLAFAPCSAEKPNIVVKFMLRNCCCSEPTPERWKKIEEGTPQKCARWLEIKNEQANPRIINPIGIMIHSTATPGMMAMDWHKSWDREYYAGNTEGVREVGVHFFVDNQVICQCLPTCLQSWHCGRGKNGSGNNTHISIEMCEPRSITYNKEHNKIAEYKPEDPENRSYFNAALKNMVDLCAYLIEQFGGSIKIENIICHAEGHRQGIASNHADVEHWWTLHGVTMDMFRQMVRDTVQNKPVTYDF